MSLIKKKFNRNKARRVKLSCRNKIEYLHNQLKKTKAEKIALVEQLDDNEEEWKLEKEKVNDLKKLIECPVCYDVPRKGPVFSCPNGHLVCQNCKRGSCPTCREAMGDNKSLVAIGVIEKIPHDCKFDDCEEEYPLQYIELHEKHCYHRLVPCPDYEKCNERVPLSKITDHLQKKPCSSIGWVINETPGIGKYKVSDRQKFESRRLSWQVKSFCYMDYLVALCVNKTGDNWHFTVVMSETPENCSDFKIEMEVYETDSDPNTRLSTKVRCHPCSIDQSVADMMGCGLYVHHTFMEQIMLKKDSLKFTVSFSFV